MLPELLVDVPGHGLDFLEGVVEAGQVRVIAAGVLDDVLEEHFVAWDSLNRGDEQGVELQLDLGPCLLSRHKGLEALVGRAGGFHRAGG